MEPKIDHIVIKVPYQTLQAPPEWLTKIFTISPGGRHSDGKTENKLIVFKDGSYLELIAFVDNNPENERGHWWGQLPFGIIDWALTSSSTDDTEEINRQLQSLEDKVDVRYKNPHEGGRKRPDGTEIRWTLTFPERIHTGEAPFWCHDLTPREVRVTKDVEATTHPSGAIGIGDLKVSVPPNGIEATRKAYEAILGSERPEQGSTRWIIEAPLSLEQNLAKPSITLESLSPHVKVPDGQAQHALISELSLLTDTIGSGQSLDTVIGAFGGRHITLNFVHGKST